MRKLKSFKSVKKVKIQKFLVTNFLFDYFLFDQKQNQ